MSVICFRLQFILQFVRGQKEVIFAETAQAYFSCAQDVKLYSCCRVSLVSHSSRFPAAVKYPWCLIHRENRHWYNEVRDTRNFSLKVCSITSEPPEIDFCYACHVYPLSRGAWIISIKFMIIDSLGG